MTQWQVLDHTSTLRLLEARFNISAPNISPWRRAVTGNFLSAFNFDAPDYSWYCSTTHHKSLPYLCLTVCLRAAVNLARHPLTRLHLWSWRPMQPYQI